jgi:hypothetical protein
LWVCKTTHQVFSANDDLNVFGLSGLPIVVSDLEVNPDEAPLVLEHAQMGTFVSSG